MNKKDFIVKGFLLSLLLINFCKKADEKATLSILGSNISGNYYYFEGEIDKDISPYCGEVKTNSSSNSGSSSTITQNQFDIDSFYRFRFGDYMQIRYTYDKSRTKFSLTPSTTTLSTCNTSDFINCNSSGTATCETADGLKCGGTKTFIFVGALNPLQFQAVSGTIDWSKGYALTSDNKYVQKANLEFTMVDNNGNILQGKVYCYSRL